jgi:hypothetical protein
MRSTKRVKDRKKKGILHAILGEVEKKGTKKGVKKGITTVNTLGWVSFFAPFLPLFLYFMLSGCSCHSSKVIYHLKCSKRTGDFFWIL